MDIAGTNSAASIATTPARTESTTARATQADAKKAAVEFETLFLTQVVEEMMRTVKSGSFGGGHAEETWRSFLSRAFAEEMSGGAGTGIARSVESTIAAYYGRSTTGSNS